MDWDHLRIFLAVARSGQILGAARKLGINHATVSRHVSALEEQLGVRLVERGTQGCTLTPDGETLMAAAERAESEFLRAQSKITKADMGVSGTVRVGSPDGLGNYFLARELGRLASRHPGLTIQLVPLPQTFSLSKREADIAITLDRPTHGRLMVRKLTDYTLGLYASRSYLERTGPIDRQADLKDRMLVTTVEDLVYSRALDYAEELRQAVPRRFECASIVGQIEAVRSGTGVGVLHDYAAQFYPELVRILPDIRFTRSYWLVSHPDTHHTGRVAEVYGYIVDQVRKARREFHIG
jgi:molybdate transport repressor ModE-like protein